MSTWNRIESGIKQGLKDVAASYGIDWSGAANTASKVGPAVGGGIKGAKNARAEVEMRISKAETRLEVGRIEKAATQMVAKGAAKGAIKAIGIWGFIPDIAIFANGFRKGYSTAGN
ncbi:hypothetical protein P4S88_06805 [Anoxybacillus geothermalis]|uniref:Uncharacterized protein n=1 Tax=Geobacillus sp. (strain WCH70) TaxID=471223 RepID=C5D231_GEOSW|nr:MULTISPECIES: hypothetical protein [Geobacillus]MED0653792.1 hypothetical protein [Anoxybacillus geothermalis]ATA59239.1 hypothetical protein GS458_0783 [Geobacillus stearothermophilus]KZM57530.1 hypothetical protein A3Q36_16655 [Geobacillus stearothermophilus]MED4980390.1 hypothetical protein [Geobacillus stearothermophilus]PJW16108.1 hypothetical protein CV944_16510 [Geobacillus sp. WSUCF-018B]